jgi:uncharacterized protein YndB with AHSA1/START domain/uncharacterized damage-inducible protein DinB
MRSELILPIYTGEIEMSPETQTISFDQFVKAPPAQVYHAFTNSTALRNWFSDVATISAHPSGRVYLFWNAGFFASGVYTDLQPDKEVAFTFFGRGYPTETQIKVTLTPKDGGTSVHLTHSGIGTGPEWANIVEEIKSGLKNSLENLASVLETGEDLRFTRRPMLGILIAEFNDRIAKEINAPVTEAIRLEGVVDGMGAQAAGLQKDDLVVKIANKDVRDWPSLTSSLQSQRAGDTVEVIFYRGQEKKKTAMKLSGRPIPSISFDQKALAKEARAINSKYMAEITKLVDGITEAEATRKPEANEWNVKEVLVHLILTERAWQQWISELVGGQEAHYDDWGGNVQAHIDAILAIRPTIKELLAEYDCASAETSALIERLPDDFVARKGDYWRVAFQILDTNSHLEGHIEQMKSAIQAARK